MERKFAFLIKKNRKHHVSTTYFTSAKQYLDVSISVNTRRNKMTNHYSLLYAGDFSNDHFPWVKACTIVKMLHPGCESACPHRSWDSPGMWDTGCCQGSDATPQTHVVYVPSSGGCRRTLGCLLRDSTSHHCTYHRVMSETYMWFGFLLM